ncbi:MAG: hypothetical protein ABL971_02115 [Vicinamibacterales bacterium]
MGSTMWDDWTARVAEGGVLSDEELREAAASSDILLIGMLADAARRAQRGRAVTFVRVAVVEAGAGVTPELLGGAREVRLGGEYPGVEDACRQVAGLRAGVGAVPMSAWSLADIEAADGSGLTAALARLRAAGLDLVAEAPMDRLLAPERAVAAMADAGFPSVRLTVDKAGAEDRLALVLKARAACTAGPVAAFHPLPLVLNPFRPTTGYEDVRSVALARLALPATASVQVDWPRYGPKLAQVALAFGADDVYGAPAGEAAPDGPRRAPLLELRRHIEAAGFDAVERDGCFRTLISSGTVGA